MEESGEQCTVAFASIDTEPASMSSDHVCVWGGGAVPLSILAGSITNDAQTTVHCSPDLPCLYLSAFVIKYKTTFHFCTHLVRDDGILVNDYVHELELVGAALEVQEDGGVTMHEAGLANDLHL